MGDPFPSESLIMALSYGTAKNSSNNESPGCNQKGVTCMNNY
jgi:hypothetical protein